MVVGLMLFVNLGTLAVLKYYNFFADVLNITLFHHIHKSLPFLKLFTFRYFILYIAGDKLCDRCVQGQV